MTAVTTGTGPRLRRPPSGAAAPHLRGVSAIVAVAVLLVAFAAAGSVITAVMRPAAKPRCPNVVTCLSPGQRQGPDQTRTFSNTDLGFSFQYPANVETVSTIDANTLKIVDKRFDDRIIMTIVPAGQLTPETGLENQHSHDNSSFNLGSEDTTSINRVVAPQIGFVPGVGASYSGVIESANEPVNDSIIGASDGRLTVVVSFAVGARDNRTANNARAVATDLIMDTFTWHS